MRKVVVSEFMSVDGVMEAPFEWQPAFWHDDIGSYKNEELFASDALLLGRVTYEGFASAWPTMEGTGEFGERMNSMAKYVVSTTLEQANWTNSTIIREDVANEVARLKEQPGENILIAGSADLVRSLMRDDLIDEYRLMIHPVVAGQGKRLFADTSDLTSLRLVDSRTFPTGVIVLTYHRAEPADSSTAS